MGPQGGCANPFVWSEGFSVGTRGSGSRDIDQEFDGCHAHTWRWGARAPAVERAVARTDSGPHASSGPGLSEAQSCHGTLRCPAVPPFAA